MIRSLAVIVVIIALALLSAGCGGPAGDVLDAAVQAATQAAAQSATTPDATAAPATSSPAGAGATATTPSSGGGASSIGAKATPTIAATPRPTGAASPTRASAKGTEADVEPNDERAQAVEIEPGEFTGTLADSDDQDWYAFDVPEGCVIDLTVTPATGTTPVQAVIYDAEGSNIYSREARAGTTLETTRVVGPDADGTYLLQFLYGTGNYAFTLNVTPQDDAGSGKDAPDQAVGAIALEPGEYEGVIGHTDAYDWYTVTVEPGDVVSLSFAADAASEDLGVALYRKADGSQVWYESDVRPGSEVSITHVLADDSAGDFDIRVAAGLGAYTLTFDAGPQNDADSGGDAGAQLRSALTVEPDVEITGLLGGDDYADMYVFEVPGGSVLSVTFAPDADAEDLAVALQDANESQLWYEDGASARSPKSVTLVVGDEEGGEYSVRVYDGEGAYRLTIALEGQDDAGSGADASSEIDAATEAPLDKPLQGLLGGSDWRDVYAFEVEGGSVLTLTFTPQAGSDDLEVALLSPDEWDLGREYDLRSGKTVTITSVIGAEEGGTYYVVVSGGEGAYAIKVTNPVQDDAGAGQDASDTLDGAQPIELGEEYSGLVGGTDAYDYYLVEIEGGTGLELVFTVADDGEDLEIAVLDADEWDIAREYDLEGGDEVTITLASDEAPDGDYYIVVYGTGAYTFQGRAAE